MKEAGAEEKRKKIEKCYLPLILSVSTGNLLLSDSLTEEGEGGCWSEGEVHSSSSRERRSSPLL